MPRELILSMSVSVDGFVAGPNGEIDWVFRNRSEASTQWLVERLGQASLLAAGRLSYQGWVTYWPTSTNPFARPMNEIPKAVFSRSGAVALPSLAEATAALTAGAAGETSVDQAVLESWLHPIVAGQDLAADIQRLKAEDGAPIVALGGASFASSLIAAHVVDVLRLAVHPEILGRGLPLFAELEQPLHLQLEDLQQFATGAVIKTYRPLYS